MFKLSLSLIFITLNFALNLNAQEFSSPHRRIMGWATTRLEKLGAMYLYSNRESALQHFNDLVNQGKFTNAFSFARVRGLSQNAIVVEGERLIATRLRLDNPYLWTEGHWAYQIREFYESLENGKFADGRNLQNLSTLIRDIPLALKQSELSLFYSAQSTMPIDPIFIHFRASVFEAGPIMQFIFRQLSRDLSLFTESTPDGGFLVLVEPKDFSAVSKTVRAVFRLMESVPDILQSTRVQDLISVSQTRDSQDTRKIVMDACNAGGNFANLVSMVKFGATPSPNLFFKPTNPAAGVVYVSNSCIGGL